MSNTDKLLRAFIEVSGFDIETTLDYKEKKMAEHEAMRHNRGIGTQPTEYSLVSSKGCLLDIDEDGLYTARLREPIIDYKVTKKSLPKEMASVDIMSDMFAYDGAWGCIVKYVICHIDDINNDINDFGELKPLVKFMNRNCNEKD